MRSRGRQTRPEVPGGDPADGRIAAVGDFDHESQDMDDNYARGSAWSRENVDCGTRSALANF